METQTWTPPCGWMTDVIEGNWWCSNEATIVLHPSVLAMTKTVMEERWPTHWLLLPTLCTMHMEWVEQAMRERAARR